MMQRRGFLTVAAAAPLIALPVRAATAPAVIEEWTLLRSLGDDPAPLVGFIRTNWFAMDRIAVARGLMSSFGVRYGAGADWNVVVIVGYPQPAGFEGIRADFEAIRAGHTDIGGPLATLGKIVGTRRLTVGGDG